MSRIKTIALSFVTVLAVLVSGVARFAHFEYTLVVDPREFLVGSLDREDQYAYGAPRFQRTDRAPATGQGLIRKPCTF